MSGKKATSTKPKAKSEKSTKPSKKIQKAVFDGNKGIIYGAIAFGVIVILTVFSIIPLGSQSILSRTLDLFGAHKAAMKVDMFTGADYNTLTKMATLDLDDPEDCKKLWKLADEEVEKIDAVSGKAAIKVYPANEDYKNSFNFSYYMDMAADFDTKAASIGMETQSTVDFKKAVAMSGIVDGGADEFTQNISNLGKVNVGLSAKAVVNLDEAYFTVDNIDYKSESSNAKGSLNDWYKVDLETTSKQKEGASEMVSLIQELATTKPSSVVSKETGEYLSQTYCKLFDKVEVSDVEKQTLGYDNHQVTSKLRSVKVVQSGNANEVIVKEMPNAMDKVIKDETFVNFLIGKYDWLNNVGSAMEKMDETGDYSLPSKEEYEKTIREGLKEFNKEEITNALESEGLVTTDSEVKTEVISADYYVNPKTGDVEAYKAVEKISFDKEALSMVENKDLKNLLEDGIIVEATIYDIKKNDDAKSVEIPTSSKSYEEFSNDIMNNPAFVEISNVIGGLYQNYQNTYYNNQTSVDDCYYEGVSEEEYYDCYYGSYGDSGYLETTSGYEDYDYYTTE